jgi:imidazolonepropionase-like amidohydrolase
MHRALVILLACLPIIAISQPASNSQRQIVFRNVNVIPMDTERLQENQTLIVKGGKITYIGSDAGARPETGALMVDGRRKYIIPGLAEMHAHVPPIDNIEPMKEVLTLFLVNGVTTIRGMLGHPRHLELRGKINNGTILGPHFYTTGPSFNGQSVKTPERGAEMVRDQKNAGYDFLKLHPGLTKETFPVIASTAKEVGIPFAGHVSFGVGVWAAIDAGYSSIDHLDGFIEAITPGVDTLAEQETGLFGSWIADRADVMGIPKLTKALAAGKIWLVPTQTLAERWLSPEPAEVYLNAPEMKYMSKQTLTNWENAKNSYMNNPQFTKKRAQQLIKIRREMIKQSHKAGVGILLGSDGPQVFNVPGFSVHHELRSLVDSGLTPFEALKTGTVNVATYLGKSGETGTISVGKVSDFVLLNGNPLKDIGETQKIEGVMIGNQWLSRAFIDSELTRLEKK